MTDFIRTYGFLFVSMVLQAMLALSLYLPLMAGQLSLASPGFYALGGYTAALMSTQTFHIDRGLFPIPYLLLEMLVAAIISGLVALVVGYTALRLRGIYFALATIAFVEIIQVVSLNLTDITGGAPGIVAIPQPFESQFGYMWVAVPLLIFSIIFIYRLERVRMGRAFTAIREDELAASSIGINPMYYKVTAFTLGGILAGVTGAVSAHLFNTWNPSYGTFDSSILILAYVLVGGSRTVFGPVVGGLVFTGLPEALRAIGSVNGVPAAVSEFLQNGRLIIFGILIAVGAVFFPQGLITPDLFQRRRKSAEHPPNQTTPLVEAEAQD